MIHLLDSTSASSAAPVFGGLAAIDSKHVSVGDDGTLMEVREDCPVGSRLARVVATEEAARPGLTKLTFRVEAEEVAEVDSTRQRVLMKDRRRKRHFTVEPNTGDILLLQKLSAKLR